MRGDAPAKGEDARTRVAISSYSHPIGSGEYQERDVVASSAKSR
jgi:hypothetical protein